MKQCIRTNPLLCCLFLIAALLAHISASGQPQAVTSIASTAANFTSYKGALYFSVGDTLYKNTGTGASLMVKKLGEEPFSPQPVWYFVNYRPSFPIAGNSMYLFTRDGSGNASIWISNGTPSGTVKLKVFDTIGAYTAFKGKLFFAASDGLTGTELWSADNAGSVQRITDINPGPASSLAIGTPGWRKMYNLEPGGDYIYFTASNGLSGWEPWRSDGTAAGTSMVKDVYPGSLSASPINYRYSNGLIYFVVPHNYAGNTPETLWRTEGTDATTFKVFSASSDDNIVDLTDVNGTLFFYSHYEHTQGGSLWKTNGTMESTSMIDFFDPTISHFMVIQNQLFFAYWGGDYYISAFYKTDGVSLTPFAGFGEWEVGSEIYKFNNQIFFPSMKTMSEWGDFYHELTQSNLTAEGTRHVSDLFPYAPDSIAVSPKNFIKVGSFLFFMGIDISNGGQPGWILYKYDPVPVFDTSLKINSLSLINANNDQVAKLLANGTVVGGPNVLLKDLKRNIRANVQGNVKSVKFILDGQEVIRNNAPFAYAGYNAGDYLPWIPSVGTHNLTVIPYSEPDGKGFSGKPYTINFTVQALDQVVSFTLVNAATDQDIMVLNDGDTIGNPNILSVNNKFNIRANINGQPVSVQFAYDQDQNAANPTSPPYTLAGYVNGDYLSFTPTIGKHTITATPLVPTNGNGGKGKPLTLTFYVTGADRVTRLVLINQETGDSLKQINQGDVINLQEYPGIKLDIEAKTNMYQVKRVVFSVKTSSQGYPNEQDYGSTYSDYGSPPFTMFNWWTNDKLYPSFYTITATPYSNENEWYGGGGPGGSHTVSFRVIDEPLGRKVLDFTLVYTVTGRDLQKISNGDTLDLSLLPDSLNIRINTYPAVVGSVRLTYDGGSRVEGLAPYAVFGDDNGVYRRGTFTPGWHTLTATPYSGSNGTGTAGVGQSISFYVKGSAPSCSSTGTIRREQWNNFTGWAWEVPLDRAPDATGILTLFESPQNTGDRFGARIRGYVCAPQTGMYTFYIAADETAYLLLSEDENPEKARFIAAVYEPTGPREWNTNPQYQSYSIFLIKGRKYYIEARHAEATGADHIAVGWKLPDQTLERPIPGNRLSPYIPTQEEPLVTITSPSNGQSFTAPASITVHAVVKEITPEFYRVSFYADDFYLGSDNTAPFSVEWTYVPAGTYTLTAVYESWRGNRRSAPVQITVSDQPVCTASGTILRELWTGIPGNDTPVIPVNTPPSSTSLLSSFEGPTNAGTNYGARYRGYLCPPVSGNYIFYVSGNDDSELWLSTNDDPATKTRIAYVDGYTAPRQWNKYQTQRSSSIYLSEGSRYYIEALHKQGVGTDNFAVAWELSGGFFEGPIPGSRLSPFTPASNASSRSAQEEPKASGIMLYPNPVQTGKLTIAIPDEDEAEEIYIDITGMDGKKVYSGQASGGDLVSLYIDGRFTSGIYAVNVRIGDRIYTEKLVIK